MEKTVRKLTIKAFGITRDIVNGRELVLETSAETVGELKAQLQERYPELKTLKSFFVAVDNAYADDDIAISEGAEIALIPPVSGG
jgi:molybdopterin converting factor subunit 1